MGITFNANPEQKIKRNIDRIETLKLAIEQTDNPARKTSLNKEMNRRKRELKAIKDMFQQLLG